MLLKSRISQIDVQDREAWLHSRLGLFTSSEIYKIMGDTKAMMNYIYKKVGETLTGVAAKNEVDTEATINGRVYEPIILRRYAQEKKIKYLVEGRLIYGDNPRYASTPDGIIIERERSDADGYDVISVEAKNPLTYEAFIPLYLCDTPFDVFKVKKEFFYQVLDKIDNCGALKGLLIIHHPDFNIKGKQGAYKVIEFRIMEKRGDAFPLKMELDMLRQRKAQALKIFDEIMLKMAA